METIKLPSLWQTIQQALALHEAIFAVIQQAPEGLWVAGLIVCLAGLSEALGQSIVLFINRVRFKRFVLALVISTLSQVVSYLVWGASVWLVGGYLFGRHESFWTIASAVGLAYAPQLLAFFVLTPFIGNAFSWLLSLWSLLAMIIAVRVGLGLAPWQAIVTSGAGWLLIQVWKRTLGRPAYMLGRWLQRRAVGVPLEFTPSDLPRLRHQPQSLARWERWTQSALFTNSHALYERSLPSSILPPSEATGVPGAAPLDHSLPQGDQCCG